METTFSEPQNDAGEVLVTKSLNVETEKTARLGTTSSDQSKMEKELLLGETTNNVNKSDNIMCENKDTPRYRLRSRVVLPSILRRRKYRKKF